MFSWTWVVPALSIAVVGLGIAVPVGALLATSSRSGSKARALRSPRSSHWRR